MGSFAASSCMPRPLRADFEPGIHHVYTRGNNRQALFVDDQDRHVYLNRLGRTVVKHEWRLLTYCLMPNHVHLLVETAVPNLSAGMQWLNGQYARWFNRRHGRVGHLFQGRFGSTRIEDDAHLWMTARYVIRNPVEAGLCRRCEEWAWSGHAAGRGARWLDRRRLLELLAGPACGDGRDRYEELAAA